MTLNSHQTKCLNDSEACKSPQAKEFDIEVWLAELIAAQFLRELEEGVDNE